MIAPRRGEHGHDPNPLTAIGLLRLLAAASMVVAVQVSLVDSITSPLLRHVDLPLVVAASLVLARPTHSVAIGLIFGLVVDASGQRLFGLHCLAYAALGPVAHRLPMPAWRRRGALVAWCVTAQALAVVLIVVIGRSIAAGRPPVGAVGQILQTSALAGLLAIPVSRWLEVARQHSGSSVPGGLGGRRSPALGRVRTLRPLRR